MAKQEKQVGIVDALLSAGEDELARVKEEVAAIEQEIVQFVESRNSRLSALRSLEKLLQLKIFGRPARQARQKKDGAKTGSDLAVRIHDLLSKEGSLPVAAIATRLGKTNAAIGVCVARSGWFTRLPDGDVEIATT